MDEYDFDEAELVALEREVPLLSRLRRFADGLDRIAWFSALGEAPTPDLRAAALGYLDRLGFPDAELSVLPTWEDAGEAAETLDWASPAWEAEELARADLTGRALSVMSEEALEMGLRMVAAKAGEAAREAGEQEAAFWDVEDDALRDLAVGAAAQAAHLAALSLIAAYADPDEAADDSVFAWKFRLFMEGRWPVSLLGGTFSVF